MSIRDLLFGYSFQTLTSYFSFGFLCVFLPLALILYAVMPQKHKNKVLLAASLIFSLLVSGKMFAFLILSILSVWGAGLWLDKIIVKKTTALKLCDKSEKKALKQKYLAGQRRVLALGAVFNVALLLVLKYSAFFAVNVNSLFALCGVDVALKIPKLIMPIGISFYTLQAVSYLLDIHRGTIKADRNIGRVALYMCFFMQIVEGPICRYSQVANKLWDCEQIKLINLKKGVLLIFYGMMKKLIVADRLNAFIESVFGDFTKYSGGIIALVMVAYTLQLYMDFSGAMDAVVGVGQIIGIKMPENFKRPFFSKNISEFWTRWHVSLGTWFRDYIFYPISMSKGMKTVVKKTGKHVGPLITGFVALFCVWSLNGLWHGADWHYIFFGMYHFVLIYSGTLFASVFKKIKDALHISDGAKPYALFQMLRTSFLVVIGELFFRAPSVKTSFSMLYKVVTDFTFMPFTQALKKDLNMDLYDVAVILIAVAIVFVVGILNEKGISIRDRLYEKNIFVRWAVLYALILFIVVFGAYGQGYAPVDPMYANF